MQYQVGRRLGKGAFGEVFRAQDTMGCIVAVKVLELHGRDKVRAAQKELQPLLKLRHKPHKHILQLLNHYVSLENVQLHLVLEYCPLGTLNDLLLRQSRNEKTELRLMAEIADGVNFLHDNNIVHRDLKPDNILIAGSEETPVVKVGDFGLAKICGQGEKSVLLSGNSNYYLYKGYGTPYFMAPEVFHGKHYTCKCDVFSMGVIFVAMVERTSVPTDSNPKLVALVRGEHGRSPVPIGLAQIQSERFSLQENILQELAEQPFKSLCLSMLNKRYNDRPSARRVLEKIRCVQHVVRRKRPRSRQSTLTRRNPLDNIGPIVIGSACVGALVGFRCAGVAGAIGGAIFGLAVGIFLEEKLQW